MCNFPVLLFNILIDLLVIEPRERWSDTVSLSHLEVLSEVLISAPPVGPDHVQSLVSSDLMEVGVSNVVLLSVSWESSVSVGCTVSFVSLTESISPVLNHLLLL